MSAPERWPVVAVPLPTLAQLAEYLRADPARRDDGRRGEESRGLLAQVSALHLVGVSNLRGMAGWQVTGAGLLAHYFAQGDACLCGWVWATEEYRTDAPSYTTRCNACNSGYAHIKAHTAALAARVEVALPAEPVTPPSARRVAVKGDAEGWARIKGGKFHFFEGEKRESLCRQWFMFGRSDCFDNSDHEHADNCARCKARHKARL